MFTFLCHVANFFVCKVSINLCIMQDFSSFFFPQILNSHFISVYLQPKKAHDNNTYHFYYGSPIHLGQGEGRLGEFAYSKPSPSLPPVVPPPSVFPPPGVLSEPPPPGVLSGSSTSPLSSEVTFFTTLPLRS